MSIRLLSAVALLLAACQGEATQKPVTPPAAGNPPAGQAAQSPQSPTAAPTPPATPVEAMRQFIAEQKIAKTDGWKTNLPKPPKLTFDDKTYYWDLTTNKGTIKIKLLHKVAPMHASSTIYLTELGFYDGLTFHRVIPKFMAQGGDPLGNGRGAPGYRYDGEFDPKVRHDKPGLLSMANAGPGTDGSQFFITFVPYPSLDDKHTIFGEVEEGMEAVRALEACGAPDRSGRTTEKLEIVSAKIRVM